MRVAEEYNSEGKGEGGDFACGCNIIVHSCAYLRPRTKLLIKRPLYHQLGSLCSSWTGKLMTKELLRSFLGRVTLLVAMIFYAGTATSYSVLTHQELIDLAWTDSIRPLLLAKFPGATEAQLVDAHAYAYGGCAIQNMGYYPFGKRFFSDLTHYVRSGDFVVWLFRNARTIDEYAFAIGALSHYLGDSIGHSEAINPATAIAFPKLGRKFGSKVTYDESPHGHIRTEFAFDIDELTNTAFAPPAYLRFIGLRVPAKFLEQAFVNTYGFDIHEVLGRAHPALRSYRTSVRSFIPSFAEAEVVLHRHQFPTHPDDEAYRIFAERVARTNYERRWKHTYRGPGFKAHLLAVLVFIVPKIGGASDLAIKIPTSDTQEWYLRSVNHTVDVFHQELNKLAANEAFARRYRPRHRGTRQVGRLSAHRQDIFRTA
jgi:hypothetical protein